MSNLHPIFQQALKPFAPRSHGEIGDAAAKELYNSEAFLARMDAAVERNKALPYEQTPAYQKAIERQIQAQHVKGELA